MWVASFGNHLALVYRLARQGDVAPDTNHSRLPAEHRGGDDQQSVCAHIRYEARRDPGDQLRGGSADRRVRRERLTRTRSRCATIEGANTMTNRTMHAIAYDELHDEIVVPSRAGQAIMTFRGERQRQRGAHPHHPGTEDRAATVRQTVGGSIDDEVLAFFGGQVCGVRSHGQR